ncbi:MAG: VCBS repeat-containing protein [Verrucomicrobiales bacterium]
MQTAPILAAAVCLSAPAGAFAQIIFQERTDEAGLAEPLAGMMGHGGAWGDFDGDGRIDLFVGGFADRPDAEYAPAAGPVRNRLFRNLGGGKFADAGQAAVAQFARTSGAVFADLDGDGDLDLYVANNAKGKTKHPGGSPQHAAQLQPSSLFENRDGQFSDVSARSGACPADVLTARNVGVFDYDGDGRLDLFVVEDKFTAEPGSRLLRSESGLKFAEATAEGGLPGEPFGLGEAPQISTATGCPISSCPTATAFS